MARTNETDVSKAIVRNVVSLYKCAECGRKTDEYRKCVSCGDSLCWLHICRLEVCVHDEEIADRHSYAVYYCKTCLSRKIGDDLKDFDNGLSPALERINELLGE